MHLIGNKNNNTMISYTHELFQPGALGISRAKDVGKIFSLFIDGCGRLFLYYVFKTYYAISGP